MSQNIRSVMVGCGGMAGAWLDAAKDIGVELVGFVDVNEDAAVKRRDQYAPGAPTGTELVRMLDQVKPDAVFDCTIPSAHYEVTMTALGRGIHVMGEKPMSDSLSHSREMVAAAEKSGKIYSVIQNRRYTAESRRMRHFLQSAEIGTLNSIFCDFFIGAHFGGFRDVMEHVLVLDMAIHTFDSARFLCGEDPISVYCKDFNPSGSWYRHGASAVAIFTMTNGVIFDYRGSWCGEGFNTSWECDWRFQASKGTALWDGGSSIQAKKALEGNGFNSPLEDVVVPDFTQQGKTRGHRDLIGEFVECVQHGGKPETYCADNIKSMAMVLAAVESAETGREVQIEW